GLAAYLVGIAAIAGSFVVSYGAHKADRVLDERFRVGRDLRVFVIMVGALFGSAWLALVVLAVTMNLLVVRCMTRMRPLLRRTAPAARLLDRPSDAAGPSHAPPEPVPAGASVSVPPVATKPLPRPAHAWTPRPTRPGLKTTPASPSARPRPK